MWLKPLVSSRTSTISRRSMRSTRATSAIPGRRGRPTRYRHCQAARGSKSKLSPSAADGNRRKPRSMTGACQLSCRYLRKRYYNSVTENGYVQNQVASGRENIDVGDVDIDILEDVVQ